MPLDFRQFCHGIPKTAGRRVKGTAFLPWGKLFNVQSTKVLFTVVFRVSLKSFDAFTILCIRCIYDSIHSMHLYLKKDWSWNAME